MNDIEKLLESASGHFVSASPEMERRVDALFTGELTRRATRRRRIRVVMSVCVALIGAAAWFTFAARPSSRASEARIIVRLVPRGEFARFMQADHGDRSPPVFQIQVKSAHP